MQTNLLAQDDTSQNTLATSKAKYDSVTNAYFNSIKKFGAEQQKKNIVEYTEDTIASRQDAIIEQIKKVTTDAKSYLESALDSAGLSEEINRIERLYQITIDGVFVNTGSMQTNRNLETTSKVMSELLTRIKSRKSSLDDYYEKLSGLRNTIDSLYRQDVIYKFSSDSAVLMRYVKKLVVVGEEIRPIDSSIKKTLITVSDLQTLVNQYVNSLNSSIAQIEVFQAQLASRRFKRETVNLTGAITYRRPFNEIVDISIMKGAFSFLFYIGNEIPRLLFLLVLVVVATIFLRHVKRSLRSQNILNENEQEQIVLRYPFLSSVLIVLNLFQFFLPDPPFAFNAIIWTTSAICLTVIFRNFVSRYWKFVWLTMFAFFLLAEADNLILQASRTERWIMFTVSVLGVIVSSAVLVIGRSKELKEKLIVYFIALAIVLQLVSVFANLYGRYNLAKTCFTSGFFNVIIAILFLWTLRFFNDVLALSLKAYKIPGKRLFYIDLDRKENKIPPVLYLVLIIGWFVLFARNFYVHNLIADPMREFILQKRTIGEFSFSIGNLLSFFLILYVSALISRVVSFFASGRHSVGEGHNQKGGVGSWLLIIRIAIISIGLLLAFASIGIPMDRLTIILSALSVGVGFGLQTLVNNLVSGLIIAFEKPINVGDMVEIGGQAGTIKSIGFRSSVISTGTGSEVVIPNGSLLNQNLVNWTHDNNHRGVDIPVGVAYGSDLTKVINVLKEIPKKDDRILKYPEPGVTVKQFSSSAIDLQLSFWVRNLREWVAVKSDIIIAIDKAFKENGIEIPFPQQDLHITSIAQDVLRKQSELAANRPPSIFEAKK